MPSHDEDRRQQRVLDLLESRFQIPEASQVTTFLDEAEEVLLALVHDELMNVIARHARKAKLKVRLTENGFMLGRATFLYLVNRYRRALAIEIDDLTGALARLDVPWAAVQLDSPGRILTIRLRTVGDVAHLNEDLLAATATVVVASYRWLQASVMAVFSRLAGDLASELYVEIRKRVPSEVADLVWLAIHSQQRTHYLVDSHGSEIVLARAGRKTPDLPFSPLDLLSEIESVSMDFELTHSHIAIKAKHAVPQELSHPNYARIPLQIAEEIAYETGSIRVQPLIWEGDDLLTGSYPPAIKATVEPLLKELAPRFQAILKRRRSAVRRLGQALRRQMALPASAGPVADFTGRVIGGVLKGFSEG